MLSEQRTRDRPENHQRNQMVDQVGEEHAQQLRNNTGAPRHLEQWLMTCESRLHTTVQDEHDCAHIQQKSRESCFGKQHKIHVMKS
jgi:hypothetical protein